MSILLIFVCWIVSCRQRAKARAREMVARYAVVEETSGQDRDKETSEDMLHSLQLRSHPDHVTNLARMLPSK